MRKENKGVYTELGAPFFFNRYIALFSVPKKNVTFFSVIFTMVISLEKYENAFMYIQCRFH